MVTIATHILNKYLPNKTLPTYTFLSCKQTHQTLATTVYKTGHSPLNTTISQHLVKIHLIGEQIQNISDLQSADIIIATNKFLYKINIRSDELCSFCQNQVETIRHLFCQCNYVKTFWKQLEYLFQKNNVAFYGNQGLSDRIILFGLDGDKVVNVILLLAKFHIYRSRVQNGKPNYKSFLAEIKKYIRIVKYIAISNRNINRFDQMWGLWKI